MADRIEGGEHPEGRAAIDRMVKQLRDSGASSEDAERIARSSARRHDYGQGAKKKTS
jgi:hypothetical protein